MMRSVSASLLLVLALGFQSQASAQYPTKIPIDLVRQTHSLPERPGRSGFSMSVFVDEVVGNGYQPVYFRFAPTRGKAFAADRTFDVRISVRDYHQSEMDFEFQCVCEVHQGRASDEYVVYIPCYVPWDAFLVDVLEDGRRHSKSPADYHLGDQLRLRNLQQDTTIGVIYDGSSNQTKPWQRFPDLRSVATVWGSGPIAEDVDTPRLADDEAFEYATNSISAQVQARAIEIQSLHSAWLGYSQLDVIMIAEPLLEQVASDADLILALKHWIAAGGNMVIYAARSGNQNRSLLGGSDHMFGSAVKMKNIAASMVTAPNKIARTLSLSEENDTSPFEYEDYQGASRASQGWQWSNNGKTFSKRKDIYKKMQSANHPAVQYKPSIELADTILVGQIGIGKVIAIDEEDPFPGSFQMWYAVRSVCGARQLSWIGRNGIDVRKGDDHYWLWLIPGVGQPPVKAFFLLNTVFILIIGPICYLMFRRKQRLYLLLFFAPALALVVTTGLFAYAMVADGFQPRLRSRQITWQDADSGWSVTQARQTYFSVFGSREGLQVTSNTAVYPILNQPAEGRYYYSNLQARSTSRSLTIGKDKQILAGEFLPSRTQVQYLHTTPKQMKPAVEIVPADGRLQVTNSSDANLIAVVAMDAAGSQWFANNVSPGESATMDPLKATPPSGAIDIDQLVITEEVPQLRDNYYRNTSTGADVSLLEDRLNRWLMTLPPQSFIATTELDQETLGIDGARVDGSVHVIMGKFQ